jgi:beta-xylosidase
MKKRFFKTLAVCLAFSSICGVTFSGCSENVTVTELSYYHGEQTDEIMGKPLYNKDLFYRNDYNYESPDPFIFDDTERSGYYYIYSTTGRLYTKRSKDLVTWEAIGQTLSFYQNRATELAGTITKKVAYESLWAPEVVYDDDTELYYAFFSAKPQNLNDVVIGQGVQPYFNEQQAMFPIYVASSTSPEGPFELVNFRDQAAIDGGYYHVYNTESGRTETTEGTTEVLDSEGYVFAYPYFFAEYSYFNPQDLRYYMEQTIYSGIGSSPCEDNPFGCGMGQTIDAHHFVDDNGDKYLYWVTQAKDGLSNRVLGVKMAEDENGKSSWLKPDWSTVKLLSVCTFYTVEDYLLSLQGETVAKVPYENVMCNEGPSVLKHNGKYYLTLSSGGWSNGTYSLVQAVADSPLGPFRKLTPAENGQFLSPDAGGHQEALGGGHHSFVSCGDKLFIGYHKYKDYNNPKAGRHFCVDEMKWVTIKDKDGKDLDVLYTNGATVTEQPLLIGEYKNIANEATITLNKGNLISGSSESYLNDDLLSIYQNVNREFIENYIKETEISKTTTFELSFDTARTVKAIMVYNSKNSEKIFTNISVIDFVCDVEGVEKTYRISNLKFDTERYADFDGVYYTNVVRGAAAYAEFNELNVKKIKITVDVPKNQTVGISEIRVLGK